MLWPFCVGIFPGKLCPCYGRSLLGFFQRSDGLPLLFHARIFPGILSSHPGPLQRGLLVVGGRGKNDYRGSKGGEGRREWGRGKMITGLPKVGRGEGSTSLNWMKGLVAELLCRVGEKMNPQKLLLC